jgi:predicted MPP superfamily phosphohydrolase
MPDTKVTLPELSPAEQATLAARLGTETFARRVATQQMVEANPGSDAAGPINIHRVVRRSRLLMRILRTVGMANRGRRNLLAIRREENVLRLRGLPAAFRGARLLHVSDLHADIDAGIVPAVIRAIGDWEYDSVMLTGDYRAHTRHEWNVALHSCGELTRALRSDALVFAVLGNHDPLEMVPGLEALGWRVLLNEAVPWRRGDSELWIAGVDDDHTYHTADVAQARAGIPRDACALLLSHTPATFAEAAQAGFAGVLSGHTHGGQICLPGGIALYSSGTPRWLLRGPWAHRGMSGYTSRGVGASGVPARFFCPPEVTRHTLEPA